jgi:hypothetical protein
VTGDAPYIKASVLTVAGVMDVDGCSQHRKECRTLALSELLILTVAMTRFFSSSGH